MKTYRLSPNGQGRINLAVTVTFDVKNYSDSVREYEPCMQEEGFYNPQVRRLEYGLAGGQSCHEFDLKVDPDTQVRTAKGKKKVRLKPFRRSEKAVCSVMMEYDLTMPEEYTDLTSFGGAVIGAKVRVDSLPPDFEFFVGNDTSIVHSNGGTHWYFDRPFITGQAIRVWWRKKK